VSTGGTADTPVVVEVALSTRPDRNPHAPRTLEDARDQGLACIDAGASIVHMHLPNLQVPAAEAAEQYLACFRPWLARDPDVLVLPTNGWGDGLEERFAHQFLLHDAGALRLAFVDPGATVFGWPGPDGAPAPDGIVYSFNYDAMSYAIDEGRAHGMAMHFAIFEPGWLRNVMAYWRAGRLSPGSFVKFYFGGEWGILARGRGVTFGLPPTLTGLAAYREILDAEGCGLPWFSAVVGGDLIDTPVARATVEQGGHLRVGLEDHAGDRSPTNVELVEEAVALCREVGRPVATPAQAVGVLGLPARPRAVPPSTKVSA
jgi:3-keto-5-aminohexanoate cleavage enzyme